jgi:hypothetical protein
LLLQKKAKEPARGQKQWRRSREFVKSRNYRSQRENSDHGDDDEA